MKEYQLHGLRALAQSPKGTVPAFLQAPATQGAWRFHHALEDYGPTPLVRLNGLAEELGLGGVFVKDESHRFGLNAFKGLGGIYALSRAVARELGSAGGGDLGGITGSVGAERGQEYGVCDHHRRKPRAGGGLGGPEAGL